MDGGSIAAEIRAAREESGLTQTELAARTGTTQSAISRLESGRVVPTLVVLERVAEATGRPITVVVGPGPKRSAPAAAGSPPPLRVPRVAARAVPRPSAGRPLPSSARHPHR